MSETYVVRISGDIHPHFVGPLTYDQARDLSQRLAQANIPYECGQLLVETDLPGLWI